MAFEKIQANYMVLCDTSIMFVGTKQNCQEYYNSLPDPVTMYLVKVNNKWKMRRRL